MYFDAYNQYCFYLHIINSSDELKNNIFEKVLAPFVLIIKTIIENFISFILLSGITCFLFSILDKYKDIRDFILVLIGLFLSAIVTMYLIEPIKQSKAELNFYDQTEDILDNLKSMHETISYVIRDDFHLLPSKSDEEDDNYKNMILDMYEIKNLKFNSIWGNSDKYKQLERSLKANANLVSSLENEIKELFEVLDRLPKNLIIYNYYFKFIKIKEHIKRLKCMYGQFNEQQNESCESVLKMIKTCDEMLLFEIKSLHEDFYLKIIFKTSKWLFD